MTKAERNKIFEENKNLIYYTVNKYFDIEWRKKEDLYQVAALSMLTYIPNIDEKKGRTCSTYLVKCMVGSIRRFLQKDMPVYIPSHCFSNVVKDEKIAKPASLDYVTRENAVVQEIVGCENDEYSNVEYWVAAQQTVKPRDYDILIDTYRGYTVKELALKYGLCEKSVRVIRHKARLAIKEAVKG